MVIESNDNRNYFDPIAISVCATMPAVKAANPKAIFAADDWRALTHLSNMRGIGLIIHAWIVVIAAAWGGALLWQWHWTAGLLATPVVLAIVGGRQLGLSILMHEAAHGLLHRNRTVNHP